MKKEIITIDFSMKYEEIENIIQEIKKGLNYVLNETNGKAEEIFYLAPEWFINILKAYSQSTGLLTWNIGALQPHYKNELVVFNKNYVFQQKCSNYIIELKII